MYIKIVGFKCHVDCEYTLPAEMILLKGPSGAGKSTILQAIFWCLYGSMRGIYNNSGEVTKCSVTLRINQLVIYRQKKPELFKVTIVPLTGESTEQNENRLEKVYEDEVAQKIVDQAFGPRELWKACSYISQKERCSLLSGSAAERLTLLNELSFESDDPKDYISKIDEKLKEVNTLFTSLQAEFVSELGVFTEQLKDRPISVKLTEGELAELDIQMISLQTEIDRLYKEVLNQERLQGSYNMISSQINTAQKQLDQISKVANGPDDYDAQKKNVSDNLLVVRRSMESVKEYNNLQERHQRLASQILSTDNQIKTLTEHISFHTNEIKIKNEWIMSSGISEPQGVVTEQIIWQTKQTETLYTTQYNEAISLGCLYDKNSINETCQRVSATLNDLRNAEKNSKIYLQIQALRKLLTTLPSPDP